MSDDVPDQRAAVVAIVLFGAIVGLIVSDLIADYAEGAGWGHLAVELVVLIAAALGAGLLWVQLRRSRSDLAAARAQAAQWRKENRMLLQGLGAAIDRQFRLAAHAGGGRDRTPAAERAESQGDRHRPAG